MFRYVNNSTLTNDHGTVMSINGNLDLENRNVDMQDIKNGNTTINQEWDLVYVDQYPDEPKKGEMNNQFGLVVQRPFHIISEMGEQRYLSALASNV